MTQSQTLNLTQTSTSTTEPSVLPTGAITKENFEKFWSGMNREGRRKFVRGLIHTRKNRGIDRRVV